MEIARTHSVIFDHCLFKKKLVGTNRFPFSHNSKNVAALPDEKWFQLV